MQHGELMHRLYVVVTVLDGVVFQRQIQLVPHESDVTLNRLWRHLDLCRKGGAVRIFACLHDLVDFEHPPHGDPTGAFADDRAGKRIFDS